MSTVRRTTRIAAALAIVGLMMGAESPGCQRRGEVHSERHPAERQVPPDALVVRDRGAGEAYCALTTSR